MKGFLRGLFAANPAPRNTDELDRPLLFFGNDCLRLRDCVEGILVTGSTGSGKTSGTGGAIAKAYLRHGFGGLVLCTKPSEPDLWRRYARETGREQDLIFFGPRHRHAFNYLNFAASLTPADMRPTENVTSLLSTVIDVANRGQSSSSQDPYWSRAAQQLIRNAVDLVLLASGNPGLTLHEIYQVIISAPGDPEQIQSKEWQRTSRCMQCLAQAHRRRHDPGAAHDLTITANYWLKEFPAMNSRTRACVISMVSVGLDQLLRGSVHQLTNKPTTVTPLVTHEGKIIVLDLPAKTYATAGILIQLIWKQLWQQATEGRTVQAHTLPTFCFCDEAQTFLSRNDSTFLMTARSSLSSTVYLTQTIPNFRSALGKAETDALIGNLVTRFYHQNSCNETNTWASESISKCWRFRTTAGTSQMDDTAGSERMTRTASMSDSHEHQVHPEEFQRLRRGGPGNDCCVDAIVSRPWPSGRNFLRVTFRQS